MSNASRFHTRDRANQGLKLMLSLPSGEETEDWLLIAGADSDAFRNAELIGQRRTREFFETNKALKPDELAAATVEFSRDEKNRLLAATILDASEGLKGQDWVEFLREAPQISDAIDRIVGTRSRFFPKALATSSASPKPN